MRDDEKVIGNAEAAAYVGVSLNAWRPYVARGQAPAPVARQVDRGHALPVWTKAQLDAWKAARRPHVTDRRAAITDPGGPHSAA